MNGFRCGRSSRGPQRAAGSFDRGNAPRTLEKEKPNVAKGAKGPFYAEFDITVPAAGAYQLDMLEEETGAGTFDIWVNGVLEQRGKGAVQNREASPDAGGWCVAGVFPLKAGTNTIRLEHKSRFPYFEALVVNPLPRGIEAPKSVDQVARQYGINPGFLEQWVEELRRSKGAPNSVLYALFAYCGQEVAGRGRAGRLDFSGGGALPRIPSEDAGGTGGALSGAVQRGGPGMAGGAEDARG